MIRMMLGRFESGCAEKVAWAFCARATPGRSISANARKIVDLKDIAALSLEACSGGAFYIEPIAKAVNRFARHRTPRRWRAIPRAHWTRAVASLLFFLTPGLTLFPTGSKKSPEESSSSKQFRCELSQITPPDRPAMVSLCEVPFVPYPLFFERRNKGLIPAQKKIVLAATNPQKF